MQDQEFMNELLQSLPGVDPYEPQIRNALQEFSSTSNDNNADENEEKKKKKKDEGNDQQ